MPPGGHIGFYRQSGVASSTALQAVSECSGATRLVFLYLRYPSILSYLSDLIPEPGGIITPSLMPIDQPWHFSLIVSHLLASSRKKGDKNKHKIIVDAQNQIWLCINEAEAELCQVEGKIWLSCQLLGSVVLFWGQVAKKQQQVRIMSSETPHYYIIVITNTKCLFWTKYDYTIPYSNFQIV